MTTPLKSLTWIFITLLAYGTTLHAYKRSGAHPLMLPVSTGTAIVVLALKASGTLYRQYLEAVGPLLVLIGPATVALAVPLARQFSRFKAIWWPITVALAAGCVVAITTAVGIAWALNGPPSLLASLAPKSSTMPIATGLSAQHGGSIPLAAAAVAVTGIVATMLAGPLLRFMPREPDDEVTGFALGLSAHAIGVARAMQINETAGAYASVGMGLNGLLTAALTPCLFVLAFMAS